MQSAEDPAAKNTPCPLYGAQKGEHPYPRLVRPRLTIVASVRLQNPAQMCLAQDNDVVHTFTPDRADQPFDKANAASHSDEVFGTHRPAWCATLR